MGSPDSAFRPIRRPSRRLLSPFSGTKSSVCGYPEGPSRAPDTRPGTEPSIRLRPLIDCGGRDSRCGLSNATPGDARVQVIGPGSRPSRATSAASGPHIGDSEAWPDVYGLGLLGYCDHFYPPMIGGSERVALEVYTAMRERGADISVLTALPGATSEWSSVEGTPTWTHPMIDLTYATRLQFGLSPGLLRRSLGIVREIRPRVLHASSIHFQSARVAASPPDERVYLW